MNSERSSLNSLIRNLPHNALCISPCHSPPWSLVVTPFGGRLKRGAPLPPRTRSAAAPSRSFRLTSSCVGPSRWNRLSSQQPWLEFLTISQESEEICFIRLLFH